MNISTKIKNIRLINRMTQQQFADELGISRSSVINYENGLRKTPVEVLVKISKKFNIEIEKLTNDDEKIDYVLKMPNYSLNKQEISNLTKTNFITATTTTEALSDDIIIQTFTYLLSVSGKPVKLLSDDEIIELYKKIDDKINFELFKKGYISVATE